MVPENGGYRCVGLNYTYSCKVVERVYIHDCFQDCIQVDVFSEAGSKKKKYLIHTDYLTQNKLIKEGIPLCKGIPLTENLEWLADEDYVPTYYSVLKKVTFIETTVFRCLYAPDPKPHADNCGRPYFWFMATLLSLAIPSRYHPLVQLATSIIKPSPLPIALLPPQRTSTPPAKVDAVAQATILPAPPQTAPTPPANVDATAQATPSVSAPLAKFPPFPAHALKTLLGFVDDMKVADFIHTVNENSQNPPDSLLSRCLQYMSNFKALSSKGKIIVGNATSAFDLFSFLYTNSNLKMSEFYQFLQSDKTNHAALANAGKVGELFLASIQLMEYLNPFYSNGILDYVTLALAILQDKDLSNYLTSNEAQNAIVRLAMAPGIPEMKPETIKHLLGLFTQFQQLLIKKGKGKLKTQDEVFKLTTLHLGEFAQIGISALEVISELENIIKMFIAPRALYPVEYLFKSDKNRVYYPVNNDKSLHFYDLKTFFHDFRDRSLGIIVASAITLPLQTMINQWHLDGLTFEGNDINFLDCAFVGFTFNKTQFINFNFEDVYFEDCDFSGAIFSGEIIIKNCYMDKKSADSFMEAIKASFSPLNDSKVQVGGLEDILMVSPYTDSNPKIDIDDDLKKLLREQDDVFLSHESDSEEEPSPEPAPQTNYLSRGYDIAINTAGYAFKITGSVKDSVKSFMGYDPSSEAASKDTAAHTQQENKAEQEALAGGEKELRKLKQEMEAKITNFKNELNNLSKNRLADTATINELKRKLEDHQRVVEAADEMLTKTHAQRMEKERIATEQKELLNHKSPQMRAYYRILLSNLSAFFQSIALTNSSCSILKPELGKLTKHSNLGSKTGNLSGDNSFLEIAKQWLSGMLDTGVEASILLKPICSLTTFASKAASVLDPLIAPLVSASVEHVISPFASAAVDYAMNANDQAKLDQTKEIYEELTPHRTKRMGDEISRKVSFLYEEQICLLSLEGAKAFAEYAVGCISAALLNGHMKDCNNFTALAFLSLRKLNFSQKATFLSIKIPFFQKSLTGADENKSYKAIDLYQNSCVAVQQGNEWMKCYLGSNEKEEYGYMHITEEDRIAHFPEYKSFGERRFSSIPEKPAPKEPVNSTVKNSNFHQNERINQISLKIDHNVLAINQLYSETMALKQELAGIQAALKMDMSGQSSNSETPAKQHSFHEVHLPKAQTKPTPSKTQTKPTPPTRSAEGPSNVEDVPPELENLGSSCYINSCLQVFLKVPSIRDAIKAIPEQKNITPKDVFKANLKAVINGKRTPSDLTALRDSYADQKGWREGDPRRLGQQDAHEFFNDVLSAIEWGGGLTVVDTGTAIIKRSEPEAEPEVVTKVLGNIIVESSLQMGITSCSSLQGAIDKYFFPEQMSDGIPFDTASGEQEIKHWHKQGIMLDQPPYIIVQLKRYEGSKTTKIAQTKSAIQFPKDSEEVLLPCLEEGKKINVKYKISAYILHKGKDLSSGHYVAYVKDDQEDWYFANDKKHDKCNPHAPIGDGMRYSISTEAYIMVLKKV